MKPLPLFPARNGISHMVRPLDRSIGQVSRVTQRISEFTHASISATNDLCQAPWADRYILVDWQPDEPSRCLARPANRCAPSPAYWESAEGPSGRRGVQQNHVIWSSGSERAADDCAYRVWSRRSLSSAASARGTLPGPAELPSYPEFTRPDRARRLNDITGFVPGHGRLRTSVANRSSTASRSHVTVYWRCIDRSCRLLR